jgi:ATP-dependent helicase HrpA
MRTPPKITYPAGLPIAERVDEIAAAIRDHQVVVVTGETGSGKTTQLPKICLQLGRGRSAMIGHTQPRRLAARTVADRIAQELGTTVGGAVGYQVRFTDQVGGDTMVKLMTDGILLTEIGQDRLLRRYDTLIVDEAHERSLNIDFILGYLSRLLPRRPDLKVVVTSATIDPHRFARHFRTAGVEAPVVEVSGRTWPVQVRYRPPAADVDQAQAVCDAVDELGAEGPGDILVFLSGEREIRDTAEALAGHLSGRAGETEVVPLYARLSLAEQHRVFQPPSGSGRPRPIRRIVLATNVAETSLTVPGIRYVVDPGTARISRYSHRLKVQRLPIEPVSQASARQRAGRCGRVADGICVRLYSEPDFQDRPAFTEPEILRTNLASVILQMAALRLGEVADFPFPDPPDRRQIADGVRLLEELGALARPGRDGQRPDRRLTAVGRKLARLPVDPRLGRMVLEADRNGCLREVTVIASGLSIQDPRERPADRREAADALHARFTHADSDFLTYLNLWRHLREQQRERSSSQFRRMCRTEFLNHLRVREWQDVHQQLRRAARALGASLNSEPADPKRIHVSLLAGLLSHIGMKDQDSSDPRRRHEYLGARGSRFAIAPGSALFRKSPRWVMVAELVETSRLWGRIAATIAPEWVEPLAGDLVKRSYSEPRWDAARGCAVASEKVTLYGLPVVARRAVDYGRIDPVLARELFIRHALVDGDWDTRHQFFHDHMALRARVAELEHRARRRDILVGDDVLFDFYDRRIDRSVVSAAHFDRWWRRARRDRPDLLDLTVEQLVDPDAGRVSHQDFPDLWRHGDLELPLTYRFEPGSAGDGVSVHIPLASLDQATVVGLDWQVPGLRTDLVVALIRSLPKPLRRALVPAPEVAAEALTRMIPYREPLLDALSLTMTEIGGVRVPRDAWAPERLPDQLRMTYVVTGEQGRILGEGKDLPALRDQLRGAARAHLSAAASHVEVTGLRDWTIGELPRRVELSRGGLVTAAYPALVDTGDQVDVRVFATPEEADHHLPAGTRRLLLLSAPSPAGYVSGRLTDQAKLVLLHNPHGGVRALLEDCAACAVDALVAEAGGPARDRAGFAALRARVRAQLDRATLGVVTELLPILGAARRIEQRLAGMSGPALAPAVVDVRAQLAGLVRPGFAADLGWQRLPDLLRWLRAVERRLERLPGDPRRDHRAMAAVHRVQEEYALRRSAVPPDAAADGRLDRIRWMIEELRVSLFAQALGTPYPVSEQRVYRALDQVA